MGEVGTAPGGGPDRTENINKDLNGEVGVVKPFTFLKMCPGRQLLLTTPIFSVLSRSAESQVGLDTYMHTCIHAYIHTYILSENIHSQKNDQ